MRNLESCLAPRNKDYMDVCQMKIKKTWATAKIPLTPSPRPGPLPPGWSAYPGGAGNEHWQGKVPAYNSTRPILLVEDELQPGAYRSFITGNLSPMSLFNNKRADFGFNTFHNKSLTSISEHDTSFPLSTVIRKSSFPITVHKYF